MILGLSALARKQVCYSEGMVVGWAGTLLLCVSALFYFFHFNKLTFIIARSLLRLCLKESGMCRAGGTETRSHPKKQILLKPTTQEAVSPPAWRITACCVACILLIYQISLFLLYILSNQVLYLAHQS